MAPIDPSNTKRYFLDYTVDGADHTLLMRTADSVNDTSANIDLDNFLDLASLLTHQITIRGLRVAARGSNVTNPVAWNGLATYGDGGPSPGNEPAFISWHGRDVNGVSTNVTMFGRDIGASENFRVEWDESPAAQDVKDLLEAFTLAFLTVGGSPPVWKEYANAGFNAYWQRQRRRAG